MAKGLFDLSGKVTVVTGGNGGIGLGFARGVAKQGCDVAIWARNEEKNAAAKAELEALGVRVSTRRVDVTSEQQVADAYGALLQEFGRVDCVFANSGTPPSANSVFDLSSKDYHAAIDIMFHGAFYTLREGARAMVERAKAGEPGGSLVACGSLSMFMGLPGKANYAGSKAALGAIIRGMAVEFGKYGIRANVIAPGLIRTPMTGESGSPIEQFMSSRTPIPRVGTPEDFEGIAAYLASDASSFHSGDTIVIDGAYLVRPM